MKIQTTIVYRKTEEGYKLGKHIIIHQGGTRSSKTYNILIWLIIKAKSEWNNYVIDITRDTMTALRVSAMFDFYQILEKMGEYNVSNHNKSNNTYRIGSNLFRFFGADEDQKVRGPGRHILFINEMNGMKYKTYLQLNQRTQVLTIGDYNPADEFHWIYEKVLTDDDCYFFRSTFRDNPFLPERIKKEIKKYRTTDENYWRIYGLGERGIAQATIYSNWEQTNKSFEKWEGQEFYGLDFGYNDPTAMLRVKYHKEGVFSEQLLYKRNLTSDMIVNELLKLVEQKKLKMDSIIYADNARPEIIEDLRKAGFNVYPAKKEKDSVLRGINFLKKHKLFFPKSSVDLIKETRTYKWKVDKDDRVLDVPVDLNDHLLDAFRYALCTLSKEQQIGILTDNKDIFG